MILIRKAIERIVIVQIKIHFSLLHIPKSTRYKSLPIPCLQQMKKKKKQESKMPKSLQLVIMERIPSQKRNRSGVKR